LDDIQKIRYLEEHYAYEVQELLTCIWFFVTAKRHSGDNDLRQFLENAGLDHFLLHARNLLEFYYEQNRPRIYAHASDFVSGWRPPKRTPAIRKLGSRVYGEVTHLAWMRLQVPLSGKGWDLPQIALDLLTTTRRFIESLNPPFKGPVMDGLAKDCRAYLQRIEQRNWTGFADLFKMIEETNHK
jgi:hypothetical protein